MSGALTTDALADNRAGRLTQAQRDNLRATSRGWRKAELQFAGIFTVIGLLVWFAQGPARDAMVKPLLGIAFLVLAGTLVVVSFLGADPVTRDLREGRVRAAEGAIRKWTQTTHGRSSSTTTHYAEAGGVTVETGAQSYGALPEAGIVRLFYLPHSRRLVNFEQLADRPLPEGALTDKRLLLKDAVAGVFGSADARAEMAAIGHALQNQVRASPARPADSSTAPLLTALPGTWSNPILTLTFAADGSVAATIAGGVKRSGRWSIDASGRLVSDIMGKPAAAEAWVTADQLTIKDGDEAVKLMRSKALA